MYLKHSRTISPLLRALRLGALSEILSFFEECAACIAVRGNVDDTASAQELPEHLLQAIAGWDVIVTHIADPHKGLEVNKSLQILLNNSVHPLLVILSSMT